MDIGSVLRVPKQPEKRRCGIGDTSVTIVRAAPNAQRHTSCSWAEQRSPDRATPKSPDAQCKHRAAGKGVVMETALTVVEVVLALFVPRWLVALFVRVGSCPTAACAACDFLSFSAVGLEKDSTRSRVWCAVRIASPQLTTNQELESFICT